VLPVKFTDLLGPFHKEAAVPALFDKMGIRFQYPENWALDEEDALHGEQAVSVYSPGGAFWSISLHDIGIEPKELTKTVLNAMKEGYEDFEYEPAYETVQGTDMQGYDLNFYCLDLTNTALVRGFRLPTASCVVLCQAEDREFNAVEPVFRAITASLLAGVRDEDDD
jgi:hypothetical protein